MHHPTDRIAHTTIFVTPVVEHWLQHQSDNPLLHFYGAISPKIMVRFTIGFRCRVRVKVKNGFRVVLNIRVMFLISVRWRGMG